MQQAHLHTQILRKLKHVKKKANYANDHFFVELPPPGLASLSDRRAGVTLAAKGIHINRK